MVVLIPKHYVRPLIDEKKCNVIFFQTSSMETVVILIIFSFLLDIQ